MGSHFRYSRWDGTQRGFEIDAEWLVEQLGDEVIHHGDVQAALRRLLANGMRDRSGRNIDGIRQTLDRLRRKRDEIRSRGDLNAEFDDIIGELNDIIAEERLAIDEAERAATESGDTRRAEIGREAAANRRLSLDLLSDDLARKIDQLSHHDFQSADAQRRLERMVDRLRERLAERNFQQVSSAIEQMTPADMSRMKDMMSALNEMIERRERGEDPGFEQFMAEFGDYFPENPGTLDELLELIARRMAAAQAMFNSMSPDQQAQLQGLMQSMLGDADLQWQMNRLSEHLRQAFPNEGWNDSHDFNGDARMGFGEALSSIQQLGELDDLERFLSEAVSPAALSELDIESLRANLGEQAADSLQQLAKLTDTLRDAGLIDQREGRLELTPRGLRTLGNQALRDVFGKLERDALGQHRIERIGIGHERAHDTRPYEYGDPFHLDLQRTLRNSLRRQGGGLPLRLHVDDFEIDQTEQLTRSSTVLMVDLSLSMPMRDNFLPAKKVAMALHALITSRFPRDYLGIVGFSEVARELRHEQLPEVSWDFVYGTNMQHGLMLARRMLARQGGTKQIIMITDGEPTAHVQSDGEVFFSYPPAYATIESTLREVLRCTRDNIRINTFALDATGELREFVEQLSKINNGRAFFTTPETLGEYVLVDFLEHKRSMRRSSGGRRAG